MTSKTFPGFKARSLRAAVRSAQAHVQARRPCHHAWLQYGVVDMVATFCCIPYSSLSVAWCSLGMSWIDRYIEFSMRLAQPEMKRYEKYFLVILHPIYFISILVDLKTSQSISVLPRLAAQLGSNAGVWIQRTSSEPSHWQHE